MRFLRKQRKEEDFWDELKELQLEFRFDKSNIKDSSLDELSSDKNIMEIDNKLGDNTHEELGDLDKEIQ